MSCYRFVVIGLLASSVANATNPPLQTMAQAITGMQFLLDQTRTNVGGMPIQVHLGTCEIGTFEQPRRRGAACPQTSIISAGATPKRQHAQPLPANLAFAGDRTSPLARQ